MTYNLANPLDVQSIRLRLEALISKGCIVDMTEKKVKRSLNQNSYLHVAIQYLAVKLGEPSVEWVKREYYKKTCNADLFVRVKEDKLLGQVKYLRSSAELDKAEMTLSITRFRNWASQVAGEYIPEPHEQEVVAWMISEVEKNKGWIY